MSETDKQEREVEVLAAKIEKIYDQYSLGPHRVGAYLIAELLLQDFADDITVKVPLPLTNEEKLHELLNDKVFELAKGGHELDDVQVVRILSFWLDSKGVKAPEVGE